MTDEKYIAALETALRDLMNATEKADNPGDMGVGSDDAVMRAAEEVLRLRPVSPA